MRLLLLGATGLVGGSTLMLAIANPAISEVVAAIRHLQSDTDGIIGGQPAFANDLVPADAIVWTQPQPGNRLILGFPFAHIVAGFADDRRRGHHLDAQTRLRLEHQ